VHTRPDASVARKINREIVVLIGWGRAILLQLAHPLVAAAISDNSEFHSGVGGYARRAHQTIGAMLDLTFGTAEEAQRIVDRINGIHDRVNGRLGAGTGAFPGGTPYSARDPKLLIWVHATLVESLAETYELLVGPLTAAEKDRYAAEATWLTHELGAPLDAIPADYTGVQAFMRDMRAQGEVVVGDNARRMAGALLSPPVVLAAPVFWVSRLMTIGLLPDDIRREYGFEWSDRRARRFRRASALIRTSRRVLPRVLREWPAARRTDR
jgi:uncharacterized protein (DUF2236 family)